MLNVADGSIGSRFEAIGALDDIGDEEIVDVQVGISKEILNSVILNI